MRTIPRWQWPLEQLSISAFAIATAIVQTPFDALCTSVIGPNIPSIADSATSIGQQSNEAAAIAHTIVKPNNNNRFTLNNGISMPAIGMGTCKSCIVMIDFNIG